LAEIKILPSCWGEGKMTEGPGEAAPLFLTERFWTLPLGAVVAVNQDDLRGVVIDFLGGITGKSGNNN
jgi:hypothetical protein